MGVRSNEWRAAICQSNRHQGQRLIPARSLIPDANPRAVISGELKGLQWVISTGEVLPDPQEQEVPTQVRRFTCQGSKLDDESLLTR